MNSEINIRVGSSEDAKTIAEFNIKMASETENKTLPYDKIQPGVNNLMENPQYGFYLVAEISGKTVGCLMITKEWSDWRNGLFWWVQSVFVAPEARRKGVYSKLYNYAKQLAGQSDNVCGIRLYVEKDNLTAQNTYQKLGMIETDYKLYEEEFSHA